MKDANRQVGTRPLAVVVPDCEIMLADPAAHLKRGELRIGARRVPWWQFLLVPVLFGLGMYLIPARIGYALAIAAPIYLGALIYWAWPAHRELIMRADGVEFVHGDAAVRCPWSLFSSPGQAFVRTANWLDTEITLPILFEAVHLVEFKRDGSVYRKGRHFVSKLFWFHSDDEVCLASVYEMRPQDLGDLLLHIGKILGSPTPVRAEPFPEKESEGTAITAADPRVVAGRAAASSLGGGTVPAEAEWIDIKSFPVADRNGWITIPVTRLVFAPRCCDCCTPSVDQYYVQIDEGFRLLRLVPFLGRIRPEKSLEVLVPFCPPCHRKDVAWQIALSALTLGLGFAPLGFLALIAFAGLDVGLGLMLFVLALIFAPIFSLISRKPFQARYNESAGTISLRFRAGVPAEEMLVS